MEGRIRGGGGEKRRWREGLDEEGEKREDGGKD